MMWRWIGLASLFACRQVEIAYLTPPPLDGETLIVAVSDGVRAVQITAAAKDDFELVLEAPGTDRVDVAVVGLAAALEELELEAGPVPEVDGVPIREVERAGVSLASWTPAGWDGWNDWQDTGLPDVFAGVRLPRAGCIVPVDERIEVIGDGTFVALAAPLDDETALLVIDDRASVWSPAQGVLDQRTLPRRFAGSWYDAAHRRAHLGAAEGSAIYTLDAATLDATFTASVAEPLDFGQARLIGGLSDGSDLFLVALSSGGHLLRFESGSYQIVAQLDIDARNTDTGGVLVRSRTEVILGADHHAALERFDGAGVVPELESLTTSKGFAALAEVPELGPIAVELSSGVVFARSGSDWRSIGTTFPEARLALVLGPRHFIVSDGFGHWNEHHPVHGLACGIVESGVLNEALALFRLGRALYGIGPGAGGLEIVHLADLR